MNIKKILKFYLIFTLSITSVSLLGYNDTMRQYFSGFLGEMSDSYKYSVTKPYASIYMSDTPVKAPVSKTKFSYEKSKTINFSMSSDAEKRFAQPGQKGADAMQFLLKTQNEILELKDVNLKITGVEAEKIEKAYLFDGEKEIANTSPANGYLKFSNLDYVVPQNSKATLKVKLDLSPELKTNNRIRLDIEKSSDISIEVGGKNYAAGSTFPMKGKYLSIAKQKAGKKVEAKKS